MIVKAVWVNFETLYYTMLAVLNAQFVVSCVGTFGDFLFDFSIDKSRIKGCNI